MNNFEVVIIGSGPAGLGAAFGLLEKGCSSVLMIEKRSISSGGLRNDCKQNYTYPVGFPELLWTKDEAENELVTVEKYLNPRITEKKNLEVYKKRAAALGVDLLDIRQAHVGTDKAPALIGSLIQQLEEGGITVWRDTDALAINYEERLVYLKNGKKVGFKYVIAAPGRAGFDWLQDVMKKNGIGFSDNSVDIGIRVECSSENYPIVKDYYDPKFVFPYKIRSFCTNSGAAHVVKEKYEHYYSVNGHSLSQKNRPNNLVNFAMLKTIELTDPVASGQYFAQVLGQMAMQLAGGQPMMQRVGDFRLGKRSNSKTFNGDLYDFKPTLASATPGDLALAVPAKILRHIWSSLKMLDTIIPGVLHPSTILYYPEIKTYANRPVFINRFFEVKENMFMVGDGAGTSRGITAAWSSGAKAAKRITR
ncbi:MAG TPA: FAD-dependent oxidoreductase [Spirochaetota bacterium]|nr:FAD-dependent oxidoreductase [Spirochaetota bacterium]